MLISISRRKRGSKKKGKKATNPRSVFLKAFFTVASGDFANSLMDQFMSGNYEKFVTSWSKLSAGMLKKAKERAIELGKYKDEKDAGSDSDTEKAQSEPQEAQIGDKDED